MHVTGWQEASIGGGGRENWAWCTTRMPGFRGTESHSGLVGSCRHEGWYEQRWWHTAASHFRPPLWLGWYDVAGYSCRRLTACWRAAGPAGQGQAWRSRTPNPLGQRQTCPGRRRRRQAGRCRRQRRRRSRSGRLRSSRRRRGRCLRPWHRLPGQSRWCAC